MDVVNDTQRGPGYVYLIRHRNSNGLHKIGRTIKPDSRMNQLGGEELEIIALVLCTDANEVERELHRQYASKRLPQSEWFNLSIDEVQQVQSKLEEVFTDGRRFIKLHGKNLPSLSQVREKERQLEALEMQLSNLKEIEIQYKSKEAQYQDCKRELASQLTRISELEDTILQLSNYKYDEEKEEFDKIIYSDLKHKAACQSKQIELLRDRNKWLEHHIQELHEEQKVKQGYSSIPSEDLWGDPAEAINQRMPSNNTAADESDDNLKTKRLQPIEYCDENLFNRTHNPERDRAFLKAWNLRWFNSQYRPRMND